ncbi:hypothetical protein [Agromyces sp. CCNWLW203]|uniref:hypothetical protein n=1 Tax=Agromyces sp. CCNWLW203 TaxID=3112842 RepID=UPI002F961414
MKDKKNAPTGQGWGEDRNPLEGRTIMNKSISVDRPSIGDTPELREWCASMCEAHAQVGRIKPDDHRFAELQETSRLSMKAFSQRDLGGFYFSKFIAPELPAPPLQAPSWAVQTSIDWHWPTVSVTFLSEAIGDVQMRDIVVVDLRTAELRTAYGPQIQYEKGIAGGFTNLRFLFDKREALNSALDLARLVVDGEAATLGEAETILAGKGGL